MLGSLFLLISVKAYRLPLPPELLDITRQESWDSLIGDDKIPLLVLIC